MKRTPSLTLITRDTHRSRVATLGGSESNHVLSGSSQELIPSPFDARYGSQAWSSAPGQEGPLPSLLERESTESTSPWAYGAEPGEDVWRPPPNCQMAAGFAAGSLSKCSFCHRNLGGTDIFMYRGEKAFCSLECRHHQILIDDRQAMSKPAGKRYSMVPFLDTVDAHGGEPVPDPFWRSLPEASKPNMHAFV